MTIGLGIRHEILSALAKSDSPMSLGELEHATGFSPSQVSSSLSNMMNAGYLGLSRTGEKSNGYAAMKGKLGFLYTYDKSQDLGERVPKVVPVRKVSTFYMPDDIGRVWKKP